MIYDSRNLFIMLTWAKNRRKFNSMGTFFSPIEAPSVGLSSAVDFSKKKEKMLTRNMMAIKSQFNGEDECESVEHDVSKDRENSFILHRYTRNRKLFCLAQTLINRIHDILSRKFFLFLKLCNLIDDSFVAARNSHAVTITTTMCEVSVF